MKDLNYYLCTILITQLIFMIFGSEIAPGADGLLMMDTFEINFKFMDRAVVQRKLRKKFIKFLLLAIGLVSLLNFVNT